MVVEGSCRDDADRPAAQPGGQKQLGCPPPKSGQDQHRQPGQIHRAPAQQLGMQRIIECLRGERRVHAPKVRGDAAIPPQAQLPVGGVEQGGKRQRHGGAEDHGEAGQRPRVPEQKKNVNRRRLEDRDVFDHERRPEQQPDKKGPLRGQAHPHGQSGAAGHEQLGIGGDPVIAQRAQDQRPACAGIPAISLSVRARVIRYTANARTLTHRTMAMRMAATWSPNTAWAAAKMA